MDQTLYQPLLHYHVIFVYHETGLHWAVESAVAHPEVGGKGASAPPSGATILYNLCLPERGFFLIKMYFSMHRKQRHGTDA